jgi:hypothetical protein
MKSKSTRLMIYLQNNAGNKLTEIADMILNKLFILKGGKFLTLILICGLFISGASHTFAQTFTSVSPGGNWNNAANWNPAAVPTAGSNVIIASAIAINVIPAVLANLTINSTLDVSTYTVLGTGTFSLAGTGSLLIGNINNFPSGFSTMILSSGTDVLYYLAGAQTISAQTYGNLILGGSGIKTLPASSLVVIGNLTLQESATMTVSNSLPVGGTTKVSETSVLTLGAPEVLSNSGAIILDGGTFRTGAASGNSETVGTLNLANNSIIALGTGTHTLTFAASDGVAWSGTSLTITGWTGSPGSPGAAGRIFFGNSAGALTPSQLAKISFTGYAGNNATLLSTGELVPSAITGIEDVPDNSDLIIKCYPNPISAETTIGYILPSDGYVTLTLCNLAGQVLKTIVSERQIKGDYTICFDASFLTSGTYIGILQVKSNGNGGLKTFRIIKRI